MSDYASGLTLAKVAAAHGISQERVRQIIVKAIRKSRTGFAGDLRDATKKVLGVI
jgi:DNA-directed RNA polymerase sigma subunit (sigma70/sigma32)